jgi:AraC-like DNA-binding protein
MAARRQPPPDSRHRGRRQKRPDSRDEQPSDVTPCPTTGVRRADPLQNVPMSSAIEQRNRRMLRARDRIDRTYARPLDIRRLSKVAGCSEAHFIRTFRAVFGETPHRYLQRRRVERAMHLLRHSDRHVTDICFDVGFNSLGTFSRTFADIVGVSPSIYRRRSPTAAVPTCFAMAWARPSSFGEARTRGRG